MIESSNPDFFLGCDTWLKPDTLDTEVLAPGYTMTRHDRPNGYGNVLVMIKADVTFEHVAVNSPAELSAVLVSTNKNSKALIASVYRPPNRSSECGLSL